jgi:hypothetical protein
VWIDSQVSVSIFVLQFIPQLINSQIGGWDKDIQIQ